MIQTADVDRGGRPAFTEVDFEQSPFLVIWETTQACDLACRHCRAEAVPDRLCGGSRARAYAATGDHLEAEPYCAHVPARWKRAMESGVATEEA